MRTSIIVACFLLGVALAGVFAFATQPLPDDAPVRPARSAAGGMPMERQAPADAAADQVRRWAAASLARPLFNPDRRPIAPAASGSDAAARLPRLSGIMITPAGRRAIFAPTGTGKPQVVVEGGTIGGNLVQSITIGEVVLIGPDGRHSLHPTFDRTPAPAATAPAIVAGPDAAQAATPGATNPCDHASTFGCFRLCRRARLRAAREAVPQHR
jgi:general secretion pathway protein N